MNYRGYTDANGIGHDSYEDACWYYGADTPADCAAEERYHAQEDAIAEQDAIEARGGPRYYFPEVFEF